MKLPQLFNRKSRIETRPGREAMELRVAESLRTFSRVCMKLADLIDAERLRRKGYAEQGKFLERLEKEER